MHSDIHRFIWNFSYQSLSVSICGRPLDFAPCGHLRDFGLALPKATRVYFFRKESITKRADKVISVGRLC